MTFVADERGRVPFALIAALLLVSTLTYTSGLVHDAPEEPVSPRLIESSTQEARIQLGTVARAADRTAAREPVLAPAETDLGEALAEAPFERALELRIAVRASDAIAANRSADGTTVQVAAPEITDRKTAIEALRSVDISHLEEDRYRVVLENVTVTASRNGHVVERDVVTLETTVALPSMAVHERALTFERRLTAGVVEPGLNRGLTARLFALAWVRGYAQYGGAPISNVVANRHVGLLTNDALVDQQVAAFGRADPESRRGVARAGADVAVVDGVSGIESIVSSELGPADDTDKPEGADSLGAIDTPSVMDDEQEYDVARTADQSFADFVDGDGIEAALDAAYTAKIRPDIHVRQTDRERSDSGSPPANGSVWFSYTNRDRSVAGSGREAGSGSTVLEYDREVTVSETEYTLWTVNGSYAGRTSTTTHRTYDVSVDVRCGYDRPTEAPAGRVTERCPFGDAARPALRSSAAAGIASRYGGVDSLAEQAVTGSPYTGWETISVDPPDTARERAYESTASLRDEVRDVDVSVDPASMASSANPASKLRSTIVEDHDRFVDAPRTYGSAAAVAQYAARDAYLSGLQTELSDQSSSFADIQEQLGEEIASRAVPATPPEAGPDELSPIATSVSAEPRYLSLETSHGEPNLAARNVNLFTVPYGDVADAVAGTIGGSEGSATLSSATSTLQASNRALETETDPSLRSERDALRREIASAVDAVKVEQRRAIVSSTSLSRSAAERAVESGYARHDSVAERAGAVVDGTIADDIADSLPSSLSSTERDRVLVELRVATTDARDEQSVRADESSVSAVTERLQPHVREGVDQAVRVGTYSAAELAKRRAMRSAASEIPAGLPLTPIPGQWYATANVWVVSVEGGYDRFAVETPRAAPMHGDNGTVSYVRESAPVTLDVDGDGNEERIGRNEPIELSADTGVFVVVPPGPSGVGDTNGIANERSSGW